MPSFHALCPSGAPPRADFVGASAALVPSTQIAVALAEVVKRAPESALDSGPRRRPAHLMDGIYVVGALRQGAE
jgi:hypothetical protein